MTPDHSHREGDVKRFISVLAELRQITEAINSADMFDEVLTQVCKAAVTLFGVEHSGVAIFDPDFATATVVAEYPGDAGLINMQFPLRGVPFEEELIRTRQIVPISDIREATSLGAAQEALLNFGVRSMLMVPILLDGRLIGSFGLDALRTPRRFSDLEAEMCRVLANQVAIAMSWRQQREYLQSLLDSSDAFTRPDKPNDVVQGILEAACSTVWASFAVMVVKAGTKLIVRAQSSGLNHPIDNIRPNGISWQVMHAQQPMFIEDTVNHPGIHPGVLRDGIRAAACLPLTVDEEAFGVIWVHFTELHNFSPGERRSLQFFAHQAALAYDKALRFQRSEMMRAAAQAMEQETTVQGVLRQIVIGAQQVMQSDYAMLWPYDAERKVFFPGELVAEGVHEDWLERYRQLDPTTGQVSRMVLERGYVEVPDLADPSVRMRPESRQLLNELGIGAFQGIRLTAAGQSIGVLFINHAAQHPFTAREKVALEDYAGLAALALHKARLLEQVMHKRETAQVIAQVSTLGNLNDTLQSVVDGARQVLRCDNATVYAYDEERRRFIKATGSGCVFADSMRPPEDLRAPSAIWSVLDRDEGDYLLVEDIAAHPEMRAGRFVKAEGVQATLALNLRAHSRRVGVMFINFCNKHRFSTVEIEDAKLFAHQAAMAIWNALLYERATLREQMLDAVFVSSKAIASSLELKPTLEEVARQALLILNEAERPDCISYVVLRDGNRVKLVAASSQPAFDRLTTYVDDLDLTNSARTGIVGRAILQQRTENVGDVRLDKDYVEVDPAIRSELCVLLRSDGKIIGSFCVEHPACDAFDEQCHEALQLLAAQAEIAIHNAQRHEALKQLKGLIGTTSAIQWMRMVSLEWSHTIRRETMIASNYQRLIGPIVEQHGTPKDLEDYDNLAKVIQRIRDTPIIAPLGSDEQVSRQYVNDLIARHHTQIRLNRNYKDIDIRVIVNAHMNVPVQVSAQWLCRALEVLTDNAAAELHGAGRPFKQIIIATHADERHAYIRVSDNGRGIDAALQDFLGERPVRKAQGGTGAGVGLMLAKTILNAYGGDWCCEHTDANGTTMLVRLPIDRDKE
jgi:GAF domain-containing protein